MPPASTTPGTTAGYRLSGADMRPFLGQRVQVIGSFAPATPASAPSVSGAAGADRSASAMPEFRVVTIRPLGGPCQ
jgi:hypothetical protein